MIDGYGDEMGRRSCPPISRYPLDSRPDGPQRGSACRGERRYLLSRVIIEVRFKLQINTGIFLQGLRKITEKQ